MCNWLFIHIAFIILFVQGAALKAKKVYKKFENTEGNIAYWCKIQQKSQLKYVVCKMYLSIAAHSMLPIFTDTIEQLKEVIGPCLSRREAKTCVHINIPGEL